MRRELCILPVIVLLAGLGGCSGGTGRSDIAPVAPIINATVTPDTFLQFDNTFSVSGQSQIDSAAYANAYLTAVDPNEERTTIAAWKALNGFDNGSDAHVTFRDSKDLGYGRDMYARTRSDGGIAVYVDNYVVQPLPGDATGYGPINLDAALKKDKRFLIGTSAIEYSPADQADPDSAKIVKMFVFGPPAADGTQSRLRAADLDGRGVKHVPATCFSCHGGRMYPLNPDGSFPEQTLRSAKMNTLDPATFEFPAFAEAEQQAGIKKINKMVHDHFVDMGTRPDAEKAKWNNEFALEILTDAYGGDFSASSYDESVVPEGWRQDAARPDGVETLYKEVVEPHCIACHSLRGTNAGEVYGLKAAFNGKDVPMGNAVNFSSYEKFISYNDDIIKLVYRHGRMPMSLLNYTRFWRNPDGPPAMLAGFLSGFDVFDAAGNISPPGKPVPLPGADRTATSPVSQDASGSLLTETFAWRIISMPLNASASLANANSAVITLTADTDGDYVLELTASNAMASSSAQVTLTINSRLMPTPDQLTFVTDVRAVLADEFTERSCVSCHMPGSGFFGGPISLADSNPTLYQNIIERVNFRDPENSVFLRKPAVLQHGGGVRLDRSDPQGNANYIILLNWIRNGAPCGDDPMFCN